MNGKSLLGFIAGAWIAAGSGAEEIVAAWNFNGTTETNSPAASIGNGAAVPLGAVSVSFASGTGSSDPATTGDNAWSFSAFPAQGKLPKSSGAEFRVSTAGYREIGLRFDIRPSNTASRRVQVQYTIDGSNFVDHTTFTLTAGGAFTNKLAADFSGIGGVEDNARFAVRLVSDFTETGAYVAVSGNYSVSGTWRLDAVTVFAASVIPVAGAPAIVTQPQNLERVAGTSARFEVSASGVAPLTYQWEFNGAPIPGAQTEALTLVAVGPSDSGEYRVRVSNGAGQVLSAVALLKVAESPPRLPPVILYTNSLSQLVRPGDSVVNAFPEQSLRPGERLEIQVELSDAAGSFHVSTAVGGAGPLPAASGWTLTPEAESLSGTRQARFVMKASAELRGARIEPEIVAWNDAATNRVAWRIYVPTEIESGVVLTEFLANPASNPGQPLFNPLRRDPAAEKPSQQDEYVELVNFGASPIDLAGWRLADSVATRHVFAGNVVLPPASPLIVHGGPRNGFPPGIDAPAVAASEGIAGLGLNNDGDVISLYNAESNLVWRVVYAAGWISAAGSAARHPDRDGPFTLQGGESTPVVTPGRRFDGGRFEDAGPAPDPAATMLQIAVRPADDGIELHWRALAGAPYSVWATESLAESFERVAGDLVFAEDEGTHVEAEDARRSARYFRVSSP